MGRLYAVGSSGLLGAGNGPKRTDVFSLPALEDSPGDELPCYPPMPPATSRDRAAEKQLPRNPCIPIVNRRSPSACNPSGFA